MSAARHRTRFLRRYPEVAGTLIILALAGIVWISYNAQNGLPLQPAYRISVDVPNAAEMTKNSDVRVGGARVGQVLSITAMPGRAGHRPFARLGLALTGLGRSALPVDTRTKVRLASLLGGKYLELTPGRSRRTVPDGGVLGLADSVPVVDLDEAFRAFGGPTATGLRATIRALGDALAGRGIAVNEALTATRRLLAPLQGVLDTLADPSTQLAGFIHGAAAAASALAPVAEQLNALIDHSAATLRALDAAGPALGATIESLPLTESVATATMHDLRPVLADAAAISRGLLPGARLLPAAATGLDGVLVDTTPVLRRVPQLSGPLTRTFTAVDRFARDPASIGAITALHDQDLPTFSTSLFLGLGGILHGAARAQLSCDVIGLWARNLASSLSDGDPAGAWLTTGLLLSPTQSPQAAAAASDLHFDPYPREDATACEAGNERYEPGQVIGHPPATTGRRAARTARPIGAGR